MREDIGAEGTKRSIMRTYEHEGVQMSTKKTKGAKRNREEHTGAQISTRCVKEPKGAQRSPEEPKQGNKAKRALPRAKWNIREHEA